MKEQVTLEYPIENDGIQSDSIYMRRPKVGDMLAADTLKGSDAKKEITMFSNLCEVSPRVIESLDLKDYRKLQEVYQGFLS